MTQQNAPAAEVKTWEVGKTYLTRHRSRVRILATDLRGNFPICGVLISRDETEEEPLQWRADGSFNFESERTETTLDLTTELAP